MNKSLSTEKTMTVKEASEALGVSERTVSRHAETLGLTKNGVKTYLNEESVTIIKKKIELSGRNDLANVGKLPKTDLEKELLIQQAMFFQQEKIQILTELSEKQALRIEKDRPKVEFYNTVAESQDAFEMSKVAKLIKKDIGRNKLFSFLRDEKILRHDNEPYQKYISEKWFKTIEQEYDKPDGSTGINFKTLVTQKGIDKIIKLLNDKGL